MSVESSVTIQTTFSGDLTADLINSSLGNSVSPGESVIVTLASGNNTITPPSVSGVVITGLLIVPPSGNVNLIKLKGINGDTGIPLNLVDPTYVALDPTFSGLVLNAAGTIIGVRLIWS